MLSCCFSGVDRDGFDEDEEEDDFELLELASRLHRDEMDKKAQIQEGSGLMGPATLPAFFVPETLQPATTQKVIETTDPKKKASGKSVTDNLSLRIKTRLVTLAFAHATF